MGSDLQKVNILHITTHLGGGVGKVVLNYLKKSKIDSKFMHSVASLDYLNQNAKDVLCDIDIEYEDELHLNFEKLVGLILTYDLILIHWWNHPLMYEFLVKYTLPESRVIMWSHVSGLFEPSNFTKPLFDYADRFIFTTPISFNAKIVTGLSDQNKTKLSSIWSTGGFEDIIDLAPKEHDQFTVGYLGTVDYSKLHKDFVDLSDSIDVDNIKFVVCGGDDEKNIEEESKSKGVEKKFDFVGKVNDIGEYLSQFDVFGYPLSPYHFGTCDQALAEAMVCGIVPVVFNNPMESYMVEHDKTGVVVCNAVEYKEAIERLYNDVQYRSRLSIGARDEAKRRFSFETMAQLWEQEFQNCLTLKKRKRVWKGKFSGNDVTPFHIFLESTGELRSYFESIFQIGDIKGIASSDQEFTDIRLITDTWASKTKGTLNHYASFYQNDPDLKRLKKLVDDIIQQRR